MTLKEVVDKLIDEQLSGMIVGYKGNTSYDSGVIYSPYIPITLKQENLKV